MKVKPNFIATSSTNPPQENANARKSLKTPEKNKKEKNLTPTTAKSNSKNHSSKFTSTLSTKQNTTAKQAFSPIAASLLHYDVQQPNLNSNNLYQFYWTANNLNAGPYTAHSSPPLAKTLFLNTSARSKPSNSGCGATMNSPKMNSSSTYPNQITLPQLPTLHQKQKFIQTILKQCHHCMGKICQIPHPNCHPLYWSRNQTNP